jgi:hypothetical protein
MIMRKSIGLSVLAVLTAAASLQIGDQLPIPGMPDIITKAEAMVSRQVTPVYAEYVARDSIYGCATGLISC